MKPAILVVVLLIEILGLFGRPGTAAAQPTPATEIAGGYGLLRDTESGKSLPLGGFASVAWNVTAGLAVVGELSGDHGRSDHDQSAEFPFGGSGSGCVFCGGPPPGIETMRAAGKQQIDAVALLGGLRYRWRQGQISPFVQALIGVARVRSDVQFYSFSVVVAGPVPPEQVLPDSATTHTDPALQLGAAIDVPVRGSVRVRFAVDSRFIAGVHNSTAAANAGSINLTMNGIRLTGGIAVGFGRR